MAKRSTIKRNVIVETANKILAAPGSSVAERQAIIAMTSDILIEGGSYSGFLYLSSDHFSDPTIIPGMRHGENGEPVWDNTDKSRVRFI